MYVFNRFIVKYFIETHWATCEKSCIPICIRLNNANKYHSKLLYMYMDLTYSHCEKNIVSVEKKI